MKGIKRIVRKILFTTIFWINRKYVLRVWKNLYRKRDRMSNFIWRISGEEYKEYTSKLPQKELKAYRSSDAWKDDVGNFWHYENIRNLPTHKHDSYEGIVKEGICSVIKHNYPICFIAEKILRGSLDIFEYGCADGRNYSYVKHSLGSKKYIGYDIGKSAIDYCKQVYPENSENFILINDLKDVFNKPAPNSVALLSYILSHLMYEEQEVLLSACSKIHDKLIIYESLNYENILNSTNDTWDDGKINFIPFLKKCDMELSHVMYHPIALLPFKNNNWLKQGNCAILLMFEKGK